MGVSANREIRTTLPENRQWSGNLAAMKLFDEVQNKFKLLSEPRISRMDGMGCDVG